MERILFLSDMFGVIEIYFSFLSFVCFQSLIIFQRHLIKFMYLGKQFLNIYTNIKNINQHIYQTYIKQNIIKTYNRNMLYFKLIQMQHAGKHRSRCEALQNVHRIDWKLTKIQNCK